MRIDDVQLEDLSELCRQLASHVESADGLRIVAFETAAETTDRPGTRTLILALRDLIAVGNTLAAACRTMPDIFDDVVCDALHEGEQMGKAGIVATLQQLALYLHQQQGR